MKSKVDSQQEESNTENDFSEMSDTQVRRRGPSPKKIVSKNKLPNLERNVPIIIKNNNFVVRTIWTIVMILGFMGVLWAGHIYIIGLVLLVNIGIFKEILGLKRNYEKELNVKYSSLINWYFFGIATFFCYGKLFQSKLSEYAFKMNMLSFILNYHNIITFMLWVAGFLIFTLSLKKGYYRYQFRMFGWTHITLILVVAQSSVMIMNIFEGIVWFILPCSLVITNDIFAYIFGVSFGKTPLIELSPKKTWEGFIGGCFSTLIASFCFAYVLQGSQYLTCPQHQLPFSPFASLTCEIPSVFISTQRQLPFSIFGLDSIYFSDFQIHAMVFSLFTSLVSPFGGFFASGFKRGIKIKDFGDTIPGHGGITDRMDCQILTGMFSYLYLHQIVLPKAVTLGTVLGYVSQLSTNQQQELFNQLKQTLQIGQ
ncbi:unnamed protein product [Paramecium primaurelia]|uniref:Phosphatidate cytidylyltransferase n=1 Tax=Paramecium primaurelia TaxID=5886 RepID=A0A8S1M882_PARPR|nr:unnamed protein product [Paramecium primaurelia]